MAVHPLCRDRSSGFVISELILVLVVFSALILITVTSIGALTGESDDRECRDELRTMKAATERFRAEVGFWPPTKIPMVEGGFLRPNETPNYTVITDDQDVGPIYEPIGSRCV